MGRKWYSSLCTIERSIGIKDNVMRLAWFVVFFYIIFLSPLSLSSPSHLSTVNVRVPLAYLRDLRVSVDRR